jgi:hypothetical protein
VSFSGFCAFSNASSFLSAANSEKAEKTRDFSLLSQLSQLSQLCRRCGANWSPNDQYLPPWNSGCGSRQPFLSFPVQTFAALRVCVSPVFVPVPPSALHPAPPRHCTRLRLAAKYSAFRIPHSAFTTPHSLSSRHTFHRLHTFHDSRDTFHPGSA